MLHVRDSEYLLLCLSPTIPSPPRSHTPGSLLPKHRYMMFQVLAILGAFLLNAICRCVQHPSPPPPPKFPFFGFVYTALMGSSDGMYGNSGWSWALLEYLAVFEYFGIVSLGHTYIGTVAGVHGRRRRQVEYMLLNYDEELCLCTL